MLKSPDYPGTRGVGACDPPRVNLLARIAFALKDDGMKYRNLVYSGADAVESRHLAASQSDIRGLTETKARIYPKLYGEPEFYPRG